MQINSGIPRISDYVALTKSDLFSEMEAFSNDFLKTNRSFLGEYVRRWVADPLHNWSRQWEYPFVYNRILEEANTHSDRIVKVLDAGSGVTFFPYFLASKLDNVAVTCCDCDSSFESVFSNINRLSKEHVEFNVEDIHKLNYADRTFDIIHCISVLEHTTEDFRLIINEFKRTLKDTGILIVTFDISITGDVDIPVHRAEQLLQELNECFPGSNDIQSEPLSETLRSSDILTTKYIKGLNMDLLPWKYSTLYALKSILHLRKPKCTFWNLTCFCQTYFAKHITMDKVRMASKSNSLVMLETEG